MFKGAAIVMGVTSCGKTTVGEGIAKALGVPFVEGDRLHPAANVAKMASGVPLTDEDRWPWLEQVGLSLAGVDGRIASCSALKRSYRASVARAAARPVSFVFLNGSRDLLQQRITARKGHFMPPSLLDSQLKTLELPGPDEDALWLDIAHPVAELIARAVDWLEAKHS